MLSNVSATNPIELVVDRVDSTGSSTSTKREYMTATTVSGAVLSGLTRNADGSGSDQEHAVGAIVEFVPGVLWAESIRANASTLTGTETLTNKTLTAPVIGGGVASTVADEANAVGLEVTQNDVTNNPDAVNITNTTGGDTLKIDQSGAGAGVRITHDGAIGADDAVLLALGTAATARPNTYIYSSNASNTGKVVSIRNSGTGQGVHINQDGNGTALEIDSEATSGPAVLVNSEVNTGQNVFLFQDNSAAALVLQRNTTLGSNYLLRLGNYRLWVDSTGDLRIYGSAPTSDTDGTVVGTQT